MTGGAFKRHQLRHATVPGTQKGLSFADLHEDQCEALQQARGAAGWGWGWGWGTVSVPGKVVLRVSEEFGE